jgi:hypothetical protein
MATGGIETENNAAPGRVPRRQPAAVFNIAVKVMLAALLITAVVFESNERFDGKGFKYRLVLFLLPAIVVPIVWVVRGRRPPYPHLVDALISLPFLLDTAGNALNFYNRYDRTDDVLHFSNWIPLVAGLTLAVLRTRTPRLAAWAMGVAFGGSAILWWEEAEYLIMRAGSMGLNLTYSDTMGDLALSFSGGVVGATLAIVGTRHRANSAGPAPG